MAAVIDARDGVILQVKVVPGASRERLVGVLDDALKIQVTAAAEKGRANRAVARLLAQSLGVRGSDVVLLSGSRNPRKRFLARGICAAEAKKRLRI